MRASASSVRQVRFVDRTTFRFDARGTVTQDSLLLHDVDSDGVSMAIIYTGICVRVVV